MGTFTMDLVSSGNGVEAWFTACGSIAATTTTTLGGSRRVMIIGEAPRDLFDVFYDVIAGWFSRPNA